MVRKVVGKQARKLEHMLVLEHKQGRKQEHKLVCMEADSLVCILVDKAVRILVHIAVRKAVPRLLYHSICCRSSLPTSVPRHTKEATRQIILVVFSFSRLLMFKVLVVLLTLRDFSVPVPAYAHSSKSHKSASEVLFEAITR